MMTPVSQDWLMLQRRNERMQLFRQVSTDSTVCKQARETRHKCATQTQAKPKYSNEYLMITFCSFLSFWGSGIDFSENVIFRKHTYAIILRHME